MDPREVIAVGIAHFSQNRLRAGLSILGIFIGIASVLCMMAVGDGAKWLISHKSNLTLNVKCSIIYEKWNSEEECGKA